MEDDRDFRRAAAAIRYLAAHAAEQPALADVAAAVALSESRLQRLFTRWVGISPKRFLQQLTVEAAKRQLAAGRAQLPLAHALGLSGGGRLHELFVTLEAMTPGEWGRGGAGLALRWTVFATRFGPMLAARSARGLCALQFVADGAEARRWLQARWPQAVLQEDGTAAHGLEGLFDTGPGAPLALHVQGSNFQVQVWRALLAIPCGQTVHYGELATRLGRPRAARAVGGAVAANPVAALIPCHRVIRASGALGDYRWGAERKAELLDWETVLSARQAAADPAP